MFDYTAVILSTGKSSAIVMVEKGKTVLMIVVVNIYKGSSNRLLSMRKPCFSCYVQTIIRSRIFGVSTDDP